MMAVRAMAMQVSMPRANGELKSFMQAFGQANRGTPARPPQATVGSMPGGAGTRSTGGPQRRLPSRMRAPRWHEPLPAAARSRLGQ